MSELLQEIHEEVQEFVALRENVEPLLEQYPTLIEDAEELLGRVSVAITKGKKLVNNENIAKVLAGLDVLRDPDIRAAIAPEIKDIDPKFTIKDVIKKAGDDKAAHRVLARIGEVFAKSKVISYSNLLKAINQDPKKKNILIKTLNQMRMQYSRIMGSINKNIPNQMN